nr:hypothetical protein CFP56_58118 [Quercus suber]
MSCQKQRTEQRLAKYIVSLLSQSAGPPPDQVLQRAMLDEFGFAPRRRNSGQRTKQHVADLQETARSEKPHSHAKDSYRRQRATSVSCMPASAICRVVSVDAGKRVYPWWCAARARPFRRDVLSGKARRRPDKIPLRPIARRRANQLERITMLEIYHPGPCGPRQASLCLGVRHYGPLLHAGILPVL